MTYTKLIAACICRDFLWCILEIILFDLVTTVIYIFWQQEPLFAARTWMYLQYGFIILIPYTLGVKWIMNSYRKIHFHKRYAKLWDVTPECILIAMETFKMCGQDYITSRPLLQDVSTTKEKYPMNYENFFMIFGAQVSKREGMFGRLAVQMTGTWNGIKLFNVEPIKT